MNKQETKAKLERYENLIIALLILADVDTQKLIDEFLANEEKREK